MAPWSHQLLGPWHNLWCLRLCLILGCYLTWGVQGSQLAVWSAGLPCLPLTRENMDVQEAQGNGSSSWGQQGAPFLPLHGPGHFPGVSLHPRGCCPHTWVLRSGIRQEEASSRAVAAAVEQDSHSAGVCHQEWGRRDGVPAVGPCQQGWHHGEDLASLGTCLGTWTQDLTFPSLALARAKGGSGIWAVLSVVPELFHIQVAHPQGSPSTRVLKGGPVRRGCIPGWSHPEDGPTPGQLHDRVVPCPGWSQPQGAPIALIRHLTPHSPLQRLVHVTSPHGTPKWELSPCLLPMSPFTSAAEAAS